MPEFTNGEILEMVDQFTPKGDRTEVFCGSRPLNVWRKEGDVRVREPATRGRHEHQFVYLNEADFCYHFRQFIGIEQVTRDNLVEFLCDLHDRPDRYDAKLEG